MQDVDAQSLNLGMLAAFLSAGTWAIGVSTYSLLSRSYPAWLVNFTRALISIPLFFTIVCWESGGLGAALHSLVSLSNESLLWFGLSIVMSYALGDVFFLLSTRGIGITGSLAIASTYPLWAVIVNWMIRGDVLGLHKFAGLVLVIGGTILVILSAKAPIIYRSEHEDSVFSKKSVGVVLAFLTSCMWAANAYSVYRGGQGVSTSVANTYRMGFALLLCPLLGRFSGKVTRLYLPAHVLKKSLWVFVLEGFGGTFLFMYGLSHAPLAAGTALSSLAPVIAVPVALLSGAEKFSFARSLGVLVVVTGVVLLVTS